jgi:hypothetical protein
MFGFIVTVYWLNIRKDMLESDFLNYDIFNYCLVVFLHEPMLLSLKFFRLIFSICLNCLFLLKKNVILSFGFFSARSLLFFTHMSFEFACSYSHSFGCKF